MSLKAYSVQMQLKKELNIIAQQKKLFGDRMLLPILTGVPK